jgi:hypothetical protein
VIGLALLAEAAAQAEPSLLDRIDAILIVIASLVAIWQRIRASKATGLLDVTIAGVEAFKATLPRAEAKGLARTIEGVALAEGVAPALAKEVRRVTKPEIKAPTDLDETPKGGTPLNGTSPFPSRPSAIMLALFLPLALAGGCVSAAVHDAAVTAQKAAQQLHDTSEPAEAWLKSREGTPDGRGGTWTRETLRLAWSGLWNAQESALGAVERGTR